MQSLADKLLIRVCETLGRGSFSPRENIFHLGLCSVSARGVSEIWEYRNRSKVLPTLWSATHNKRGEKNAATAARLFADKNQFLRVLVEPKGAAADDASLPEQVQHAHEFFEETREVLKRANCAETLDQAGVQVVLTAAHVGVRSGRLRPHVHVLGMCQPGVDAKTARSAFAALFAERNFSRLGWASEKNREFLKSEADVKRHVEYLHHYPVSTYIDDATEKDGLAQLLRQSPRAFIAALAALSPTFSMKNLVTIAGAFRAQPTEKAKGKRRARHTTKNQLKDTIRAGAESEAAQVSGSESAPEKAPEKTPEGTEKETGKEVEVFGPALPTWWGMLLAPDGLPRVPPARKGEPSDARQLVLSVKDEPTTVPGLVRRRVVVSGCFKLVFQEVARLFPVHGQQWVLEDKFDELTRRGWSDEEALAGAKREAAAWAAERAEEREKRNARIAAEIAAYVPATPGFPRESEQEKAA